MVTLLNLPHEIQNNISNYLRPHRRTEGNVVNLLAGVEHNPEEVKIDPFSRARDVAFIKAVHPELKNLPLWKNHEWKERIRKWRDENLTKMRWKYQYGVLPNKMIEMGWERKINHDYRHQGCYVETGFGNAVGTGLVEVPKEYKVVWFEVSLYDLLTGVRPLPHCFGNDGNNRNRADNGNYQLTMTGQNHLVPAPSLETLIPPTDRREWLKECFMECILVHWIEKIVEKHVEKNSGEKPDFIKEFKKMMDLPSDYELSQTQLYQMFLKELCVRRSRVHEKEGYFKRSESIEDICRQEINLVK